MTSITKATGDYSISVGYGSSSTGHNGIALGFQSNETDDKSISIGYKADAGRIPGHIWSSPNSDTSNWSSITYNTPTVGDLSGTPIFVAISSSGTYGVMTSSDGEIWDVSASTAADGKNWSSITSAIPDVGDFSNNVLFVAVGPTNSNESAMISQDGINWSLQSTVNNQWTSVTHGVLNGLTTFVAVSNNGNKRVMTSTDGEQWATRTTPSTAADWRSVTAGIPTVGDASHNTLFVAVSFDSYVMTSTDGENWDLSQNPAGNSIKATSVCFGTPHTGNYSGQPLFITVGHANSSEDVVMISDDGYNWTSISAGSVGNSLNWENITAGMVNGVTLFTAVSSSGTGNRVMTSYDGINWVIGSNTPDQNWKSIVSGIPANGIYNGEQLFVAVSDDGSPSRVMISNMMCKNSIAIGSDAITGGENSIALGNGASTGQYHNSVAIGNGASASENSIALGSSAVTGGENSIALGNGASSSQYNNSVVIGNGSTVGADNSIILGNGTHNVGIGKTNPATKLDVNGEVQAISFNATSDIRLKKNISNLSNVLENVCKLQGIEFIISDDESQRKQLGFVAQDVEEIFPQLVQTENSEEKYKSISYANTCAVLVEAIKEIRSEMNAENTLLKQEIASLKQEIENLKSNKI